MPHEQEVRKVMNAGSEKDGSLYLQSIETYESPKKMRSRTILAVILLAAAAAACLTAGIWIYSHPYWNASAETFAIHQEGGENEKIRASVYNDGDSDFSEHDLIRWYFDYVSKGRYDRYYYFLNDSSENGTMKGYCSVTVDKNKAGKDFSASIIGPCTFEKDKDGGYVIKDAEKAKYFIPDNGRLMVREQDSDRAYYLK